MKKVSTVLLTLVLLLLLVSCGQSSTTFDEEDVALLTQYAENLGWLEDSIFDDTSMLEGRIQYYIYDFDHDSYPEMMIAAFDGKQHAQSLLYYVNEGVVNRWCDHIYYTDDSEIYNALSIAVRDKYSGFAMQITIQNQQGEYPFIGALKLSASEGITEDKRAAGIDNYNAMVSNEKWYTLEGTPIIANNENADMPSADLVKLMNLYTPENTIQYYGFTVLDEQVFALESSAVYQFINGEKVLLCGASDGMIYARYGGLVPYNGNFYILGLLEQADGTTQKAVVCIDPESGTDTVLFKLEKADEILALNDSYIYLQTDSSTNDKPAEITAFDWNGNVSDIFSLPDVWDTNGSLALGKSRTGCISVVTKDGIPLLNNDTLQDAALVDDGVYYLTSKNGQDAELFFVDTTGETKSIGTIPGYSQANFYRQDHELFVVPQGACGTRTCYRAADLKETTITVVSKKPMDDGTGNMVAYARDFLTKDIYLITVNQYMGNCTAIRRIQGNQADTIFETDTGRFFFNMVYDGWCYYYEKIEPSDNTIDYFGWPEVTGCMSVK